MNYMLKTDIVHPLLHLFSLKTPILGRFHQRKVTVPCASSMRKGVKKGTKFCSLSLASLKLRGKSDFARFFKKR